MRRILAVFPKMADANDDLAETYHQRVPLVAPERPVHLTYMEGMAENDD